MPRSNQEIASDARAHTDRAIVYAVAEARRAGYDAGRAEEREDAIAMAKTKVADYSRQRTTLVAASAVDLFAEDLKLGRHLPDAMRATAEIVETVSAERGVPAPLPKCFVCGEPLEDPGPFTAPEARLGNAIDKHDCPDKERR